VPVRGGFGVTGDLQQLPRSSPASTWHEAGEATDPDMTRPTPARRWRSTVQSARARRCDPARLTPGD